MKNRHILLSRLSFIFPAFLLLLTSFSGVSVHRATAGAGAFSSTIDGVVFDSEKRGLVDVDVELQDDYSRFLARTRTTGGGRFMFRNLSAGVYNVRVLGQRLGFSEQSQKVEIITFNRGFAGISSDVVYVDFYLQPIRNNTIAEGVGVTGSVFAQEVPPKAKEFYNRAIADLSQKKNDAGIANLKNALDVFPNYFDALNRLGDELIKKKDFKAAREVLRKAVEVNPKAADSFYMLGYSQYNLKQFEAAEAALRQSVVWSSRSAAAFLLLGMALRQTAKYEDAEKELLKANELTKKKSADVHWQLALLYGNNMKKYAQAADELELFLKYQPDSKDSAAIKKLIQTFREKAKNGQ